MNNDSTQDTLQHIKEVQNEIQEFAKELYHRGLNHDKSKLKSPEKELFDKYTPLLRSSAYGSAEYYKNLEGLQPALKHHYSVNSHHPQYYGESGIDGMNLLDLVEMWCDWKAATKRTNSGSIAESLEINRHRFKMSDQLYNILKNSL